MLQALLRLLGVDLTQTIAQIRGQIGELKAKAASEVAGQVKEAGLTIGFIVGGALAV